MFIRGPFCLFVNSVLHSPTVSLSVGSAGLLERARGLSSLIDRCRDEIETSRQIPSELIEAITEAGLFRLWLPRKFGGYETDPVTFLQVVEEISAMDGATGWIVAISSLGGFFAGCLSEEVVHEIYGPNPDVLVAGGINPTGKAVPVEAGYRVTGRWSFGSGIRHASWVYGNAVIHEQDKPRLAPDGSPEMRLMLFPVTQCTILDTWHVGGLRGTGSHDFSVDDIFVPNERTLVPFVGEAVQPGILYRYPFSLFPAVIAAVPLGIARGSIDTLMELADIKKPGGYIGSLRERPSAQMAIARAEGLVRSARAFFVESMQQLGEAIIRDGEASLKQRAMLRIACCQAALNCTQAVDLMYNTGGASSIYTSSRLERAFRDIHAAVQHIAVTPAYFELAGRVLVGLPPGTTRF